LRTPQRVYRLRAPDRAALHRWQAALNRSDSRQSGPMAGFLEKRGRNQMWQKRWFVVHRGAFSYFREPPDLAPIDVISLLHGCQPPKPLSGTLGFSSGHKHRFVLQALDRTYTLSAESESERKHWVDQLGLRISERKAPASDSAHELAGKGSFSDAFFQRRGSAIGRSLKQWMATLEGSIVNEKNALHSPTSRSTRNLHASSARDPKSSRQTEKEDPHIQALALAHVEAADSPRTDPHRYRI